MSTSVPAREAPFPSSFELAGFPNDHRTLIFLEIKNAANFRPWWKALVPCLATTGEVLPCKKLFKMIRSRPGVESRPVDRPAVRIPFLQVLLAAVLTVVPVVPSLFGQVLTRSYDNRRTGANTSEKILTPANVGGLKTLRELTLDADDDPRIEAQPLYVPGLQVSGGAHDVVIVCTMANNVYAFDINNGAKLWKINLGTPIAPKIVGKTAFGLNETTIDSWGINIKWGILSTPVIDLDTKTLYVLNWASPDGTQAKASHRLNALDISSGTQVHPPLTIQASAGPNVRFNSPEQKQRSALLLTPLRQPVGPHVKKTLLMACGMTGEATKGDHGWLMAFDVDSFHEIAAWTATPKSLAGGIWQAGQGPASDDQGNVYAMTSNGGWNGTTDFAESFVRLHFTSTALTLTDWFTPFRDDQRPKTAANGYDFTDQDLGSAGPILPENTNLIVGSGKDGVLYVFNRGNLGKKAVNQNKPALADNKPLLTAVFFTYFPGTFADNPLVSINGFPDGKTHHLHGSPVAWTSNANGPMLFVWGENAPLRSWSLKADDGQTAFLGESEETASAFSGVFNAMPGGMITLSANGGKDGIVWGSVPVKGTWNQHNRDDSGPANEGNANQQIVEGVLRAYDAAAFNGKTPNGNARIKLLWQNTKAGASQPSDTRYTYSKFCPPVVADGKVLLVTYDGRVVIFGL
jgi:PQQ enzyme repeat